MNLMKINKVVNLIFIVLVISAVFTFIKQQSKLNSYDKDIVYYSAQIDDLNSKKDELLETQDNVNSEEYIEEIARKKLDMYYPNETVFIEISK